MELRIVAVGERPPDWVVDGVREFTRRMPRQLPVRVVPVSVGKGRQKGDTQGVKADEGRRLLAASQGCYRVALDERGRQWDTSTLARQLDEWMLDGDDIAFLVGGADGLDAGCLEQVQRRWSLSPLTLPHMLVRVILAEQLYRAWTVLNNHPYHRD